ncbi:hypothetical protein CI610_00353 [invertebrate metagenome]|uniref:Phage tail tube protein n=1 Tax=invertebrate metagenome TaxID=1711999 RepID=A0A2H9TBS2_9ZZZZ
MATGKTIAVIGAGTVLSFEDPASSGTFKELTEARSIGALGEQGEFVETTPIAALTRTYIPGLKTPPDKEITGNDVPGDVTQEAFLKLAKDMGTVNMKVTFGNGRAGTFAMALSGWQMNDPQSGESLQWTVYGKQSGDVTWTLSKVA